MEYAKELQCQPSFVILSSLLNLFLMGNFLLHTQNLVNPLQSITLVILRIAIGWHFCFEGIVKLMKDSWTSSGYLANATGPFAFIFAAIPQYPSLLYFTDQATIWILTIGGFCLMIGLFTRTACIACMSLLALFYLAMPPFPLWWFVNMTQFTAEAGTAYWAGIQQPGTEGTYLIVNKNLIELFALLVLFSFDTGKISGMDVWIRSWFIKTKPSI